MGFFSHLESIGDKFMSETNPNIHKALMVYIPSEKNVCSPNPNEIEKAASLIDACLRTAAFKAVVVGGHPFLVSAAHRIATDESKPFQQFTWINMSTEPMSAEGFVCFPNNEKSSELSSFHGFVHAPSFRLFAESIRIVCEILPEEMLILGQAKKSRKKEDDKQVAFA